MPYQTCPDLKQAAEKTQCHRGLRTTRPSKVREGYLSHHMPTVLFLHANLRVCVQLQSSEPFLLHHLTSQKQLMSLGLISNYSLIGLRINQYCVSGRQDQTSRGPHQEVEKHHITHSYFVTSNNMCIIVYKSS